MSITKQGIGATVAALAVAGAAVSAGSNGAVAKVVLGDCAGFVGQDAAPFLRVPATQVVRHLEKVSKTLVICSYAAGTAAPGLAFSIEIEPSTRKAAEQMERYRENLSTAGDTAPWKGKLPKGAYSDIAGPGMGEEALWTDINGTLTLRKANVMIQVTMPKAKLDQIKLARASSDRNHRGRRRIIATRAT